MSIKKELQNLKTTDIYSLLLFTLFKCRETNEYSAISELAYILDEKNLLNLCEYFGGLTITIPTIEEIELLLCGLSVYKEAHLDNKSVDESLSQYSNHKFGIEKIRSSFLEISKVMSDYSFGA